MPKHFAGQMFAGQMSSEEKELGSLNLVKVFQYVIQYGISECFLLILMLQARHSYFPVGV